MALEYKEWRPVDALRGTILALWSVAGEGRSVPSPTILPDAFVEIVINLGDPVTLHGPTFSGPQPARAVVGLLERAIPMRYGRKVRTIGIRLHPARAAAFLGVAPLHLANRLTPLARLAPLCDAVLAQWLRDDPQLGSTRDRSALEALLEKQRRQSTQRSDRLVDRAVDRLLGAQGAITVVHVARQLGVTPRHLHRRFMAVVGTPPKRLERLARFARTWQQATMGPSHGWAELAYANGYADQAHLVREFRAFGAIPPAHLFTPEWYEATNVQRAGAPNEEVRFVQSPQGGSAPSSSVGAKRLSRRSTGEARDDASVRVQTVRE
jgi:AraC-like DNA-binding protein